MNEGTPGVPGAEGPRVVRHRRRRENSQIVEIIRRVSEATSAHQTTSHDAASGVRPAIECRSASM